MNNTRETIDHEAAVYKLLQANNIEYGATLVQRDARTDDGWQHDAWRVLFTKRGSDIGFTVTFKTGTGLRKKDGTPIKPSVADVLHSVTLDDPQGTPFEEWAEDMGMNPDSLKALDVYSQCQQQTKDARRFFGAGLLEQLAELLADY